MDGPTGNNVAAESDRSGDSIETSIIISNSQFNNSVEPSATITQQNIDQEEDTDSVDPLDDEENICCNLVLEKKVRYGYYKKNARHIEYIPVSDFSHTNLPEPYKDDRFDELVKYLSNLVVKINVNYISPKRPKELAVKPNRHTSANNPLIFGSGKVSFAEPTPPKYQYYQKKTTLIRIVTSCHVVFDDDEAKKTTCELFYKDKEGDSCVTLTAYHVEQAKVDEDETVFVCCTDDCSLLKRFMDTIYSYNEVYRSLHEHYNGMENNNLVICVSHPHGKAKQVSFGPFTKKDVLNKGPHKGTSNTQYHYNDLICEGCIGAPLCIISKENPWAHHHHKGYYGKDGISGIEWEKEPNIKKEHQ